MSGAQVLEFSMERAGVLLQGFGVAMGVIGCALFPAGEVDAYEFVGQGAAGRVVFAFVTLFLLVVVALGPRFLLERAAGVFMEGLPPELGTAVAHMNRFRVAALNYYRRDAVELGHIPRALKALPVGAEGDQQPRGQGWPRPGKAAEDGGVG